MMDGIAAPWVKLRLSVMMFLQYAVWGIWLPYIANYLTGDPAQGGLGFDGAQVGWILGIAGAIGALVAPFLAGQVADRFMNAERYLGILLVAGGVVHYMLYYATTYGSFLSLSIAYSIVYMPTIALTNSICFANLPNAEESFPRIRVWGTIGWIVASSAFPLFWLQQNIDVTWLPWFFEGTDKVDSTALIADSLRWSGVISVVYGIYAFLFLPRTPPKRDAPEPLAFVKAFTLLRLRSVLIITIVALAISMIHNVYFIRTGPWLESIGFAQSKIGAVMSIGQVVEIGVLAVLGFFIARLGYKPVLTIGCLAYFLRFGLFALATPESQVLAYFGIALHGFCFAFFFAAAFLFVDVVSPPDVRHSAQTSFGIAILGIGPILSGVFNGWLDKVGAVAGTSLTGVSAGFTGAWRRGLEALGVTIPDAGFGWSAVWWTQAAVGLLAFVLMFVAFSDKRR